MTLDGEGAAAEHAVEATLFLRGRPPLRFGIRDGRFAIDLDGDHFALDRNVVVKPLVVLVGSGVHDVAHSIKAARFLGVAVSGVDLGLKAFFRPAAILKLGVEIESGIGFGLGEDLEFHFEVGERGIVDLAGVEEVGAWALDDDLAVLHLPGAGRFVDLPAIEVLTVEEFDEAFSTLVVVGGGEPRKKDGEREDAKQFHSSTLIEGREFEGKSIDGRRLAARFGTSRMGIYR
jgi:hypothetical protein